jgi:hypothetical protein
MRIAGLMLLAVLGACAAPIHPTYEFEAYYAPAIATPSGIESDLAAYAGQVCGESGYDVLDQIFVGEGGPSYVRVRFACS